MTAAPRALRSVLLWAVLALLAPRLASAGAVTVTQWGALYYGAPYAVALAQGYFRDAGVDVDEVVGGDGGGTTVRNTLAAELPYGEVSLAAAIEAIRAGYPLRIVSTGVDSLGDLVLVARPGGSTRTVQDLRGKKLGFTRPGSVSQMAVLLALQRVGLTRDDVSLVAVGGVGAVLAAVRNGTIDAGFAGEPLWSQERDTLQRVVSLQELMDTRFAQIVGVVERDYAAAHPQVVSGILAARRRAVDFIYANPERTAEILAQSHGQAPELVRSVVASLVELRYWNPGRLDTQSMARMVEGLRLAGGIEGEIDLQAMIDRSYLPTDLR
jgi:NitT/TauT family transport system substrate-binding protein